MATMQTKRTRTPKQAKRRSRELGPNVGQPKRLRKPGRTPSMRNPLVGEAKNSPRRERNQPMRPLGGGEENRPLGAERE